MKRRLVAAVSAAALTLVPALFAQSPTRGAASAVVGGKKITIDYGPASLKGRSIGELLKQLPAERIWRTGLNEVSTLATEGDVVIGGKPVKAGRYSIYTHIPESGPWSLILNSDLGQPLGQLWKEAPEAVKNAPYPYLGNYETSIKAKEVLRVPMTQGKAGSPSETFKVEFTPAAQGATLVLAWGDETWSVPVAAAKK
jgi:hypothetical protein